MQYNASVLYNFAIEIAANGREYAYTWAGYEGGNDSRASAECAVKPAAGDRETRWAGDLGLLAVMGLHSAHRAADGPERNRCYNSM